MKKINKSGLTAMHRNKISAPARYLLKNNLIKGRVLDFGCGKGKDVEELRDAGFDILGYDPNQIKWSRGSSISPGNKYDTILCTYVLNVVNAKTRKSIISTIKSLLNDNGIGYVSVRRDIDEDFITSRGTEQYVVRLSEKSVADNSSFCIYKIVK